MHFSNGKVKTMKLLPSWSFWAHVWGLTGVTSARSPVTDNELFLPVNVLPIPALALRVSRVESLS